MPTDKTPSHPKGPYFFQKPTKGAVDITITESQISDLDHYDDADADARIALATLADLAAADAGDLSGELADARLSDNVPLLDAENTFTAQQEVSYGDGRFVLGLFAHGAGMNLRGDAIRQFGVRNEANERNWVIEIEATLDDGTSDDGHFEINAFDDSDSLVGTALRLERDTLNAAFGGGVSIGGGQTIADSDNVPLLDAAENVFTGVIQSPEGNFGDQVTSTRAIRAINLLDGIGTMRIWRATDGTGDAAIEMLVGPEAEEDQTEVDYWDIGVGNPTGSRPPFFIRQRFVSGVGASGLLALEFDNDLVATLGGDLVVAGLTAAPGDESEFARIRLGSGDDPAYLGGIQSGTNSDRQDIQFYTSDENGSYLTMRLSRFANTNTTALLLRYRDGAAALQFERVTLGAADSGGSGFKVLRVPN